MAKKFVRGITEIRTINNQDFNTNNVNDLLADGNDNYIHRRKADKSEEYHCLTDNIKTIKSSNNLLIVNNDNATNTATLTVKPDGTKQDKLTLGDGVDITNGVITGNYPTRHDEAVDLNTVTKGVIRSNKFINAPEQDTWMYVITYGEGTFIVQKAIRQPVHDNTYKEYTRFRSKHGWSVWYDITPDVIPATAEMVYPDDVEE